MYSRTTGQARLALRPSKKSIQRMVETVHALTVRARTWQETTELVDKLNRVLRGGSRRHEAAKGLSAARQHFCETGPLGSIDTRRLWRRTEQLWRCAWHRTHCRMSFL